MTRGETLTGLASGHSYVVGLEGGRRNHVEVAGTRFTGLESMPMSIPMDPHTCTFSGTVTIYLCRRQEGPITF